MFDSPILLMASVEIAVLLLFLSLFLLLYLRRMRRVQGELETKVVAQRDALKGARREVKAAREQQAATGGPSYGEFIDEQIGATRNHHLSLNPDRDIVLDIAPDTPLERQAVSLRHAFLIAEKEAWLANEGKEIDWAVLESKLGQIIQFYEQSRSPADAEAEAEAIVATSAPDDTELQQLRDTLENQKRHIENLEKFKKLFFDTEEKWLEASKQADQYHKQLVAKSKDFGADKDFETLLAQYGKTYSTFGSELADERGKERGAEHVIQIDADKPSVGRIMIANQEEMNRLRNMAIDQHKMIVQLRQQLDAAESIEQKDAVIAELHKQLERHERFLKESDVCAKQLETELDRVHEENHALKKKLLDVKLDPAEADVDAEEAEQLRKVLEDFIQQSSEMLGVIETLELEARDLREQLKQGGGASAEELQLLQRKLAEKERELLSLQSQHVELEERYLELKAKVS